MIESPEITRTEAQPAAVIHFTIAREEMSNVMGPGIGELMAAIAAQNVAPAGPVFAHHLRMDPKTFDFELGVPVATPVSAAGRVKPIVLPAMRVARTIFHGPYEGLPGAWADFDAWIAAEGHTPAPDVWESYVTNPDTHPDPATWRTELTRPVID